MNVNLGCFTTSLYNSLHPVGPCCAFDNYAIAPAPALRCDGYKSNGLIRP